MVRTLCCCLCALLPLALLSCGGSGENPKTPDDESSFDDDVDQEGLSGGSDESGGDSSGSGSSPATIKTTGAPPPPVPGDFEPSYRDCANLTAVYERLLRSEKMAEFDKKGFPEKDRSKYVKQIDKVVEEGTDGWRRTCEGIVGTIQIKPRWQCASDADSIKRFHGCIDGEFDDELKK